MLTSASVFIVCIVYDQIDEHQHETAHGVMNNETESVCVPEACGTGGEGARVRN